MLCSAVFAVAAAAQQKKQPNIVPNPGFEEYQSYPIGWSYTNRFFSSVMKHWFSPTLTSPDIFGPDVIVPEPWRQKGFGEMKAAQGQSYVGITTYGCDSEKPHCREYIEIQLKEPLVPGQTYMFSIKAAKLPNSSYVNNLGVAFSEERVFHKDEEVIRLRPAINFNRLLLASDEWHDLRAKFKATIPARYMIIGNFFDDRQTQHEPSPLGFGYFLLDMVKLYKTPPIRPVPKDPNDLAETVIAAGRRIALHRIYFDFDKWNIHPASQKQLDQLVAILTFDPSMEIEIIGHTDIVGSEAYNLQLSQKRANAVKHYLAAHGIDEARLSTSGKGSTEPIATNETEQGRRLNRRIEIRILKMSQDAFKLSDVEATRSGM